MDAIISFFQQIFETFNTTLMNPDWIIKYGGLYLVAFIIFAETGLFIGFFLPGDGLLFITGIMIANSESPFSDPFFNLIYWLIIITAAGIIGNMVGYWFGKKSGPMLYKRKETWIFKRKHLEQAADFYDKRGGTAIIIARFLPIVRTFAPIVGGVVKMEYRKFMQYNIWGGIIWVFSITIMGYVLGNNEWVKNNLHYIILGIVLVTTAPVLFQMIFGKGKKKVESIPEPANSSDSRIIEDNLEEIEEIEQ